MFEHYIMGMASQPPHINSPCAISPGDTSAPSYFAPQSPVRDSEGGTSSFAALASALEADDATHIDDISSSALPSDVAREHMYLSLDDSEVEQDRLSETGSLGGSLRSRRKLNTHLLAQSGHQKSIANLVSDMIAHGSQCNVSEAPLTLPQAEPPHEPRTSRSTSPSPTALAGETTTTDPNTADEVESAQGDVASADEGFDEFEPTEGNDGYGNFDGHPTAFMGKFARANEIWAVRRWSYLRSPDDDKEPTAGPTPGVPLVRARVRKRIGRRKGQRMNDGAAL